MFKIELNCREYRIKFHHTTNSTEAWIVDEESKVPFAIGYADCHPTDGFCKATGRKIALSRALQEFTEDKQERSQVWEKYWSLSGVEKVK